MKATLMNMSDILRVKLQYKISTLNSNLAWKPSTYEIDINKSELLLILYAHNQTQYGVDTFTIPMCKITSGEINNFTHIVQGLDGYISTFTISISSKGILNVNTSSTNPYYIPTVAAYVK